MREKILAILKEVEDEKQDGVSRTDCGVFDLLAALKVAVEALDEYGHTNYAALAEIAAILGMEN